MNYSPAVDIAVTSALLGVLSVLVFAFVVDVVFDRRSSRMMRQGAMGGGQ